MIFRSPVARGWREPDPDAFWGPAVHFNREIDAHVMLLNRTRDGNSNMVQEGVYISFNERIEDSAGWTVPRCAIRGGVWYPEIVGLGPADGDTLAGSPARLFMSGFSAWEIGFSRGVAAAAAPATISVDRETWTRLFGANTPARLGIG